MIDLFDLPWDTLDFDAVRRFLADAGEEGITWEAKADSERGRLRPDSIRKAACGLANVLGGYIIVGATFDKDDRRWELPGIISPDDEPPLWAGRVLRDLNPTPRHLVKCWPAEDDRVVLLIWIDPVAEPPCMTSQGRIYERVSGETLPVQEPAVLARLFSRGDEARRRVEQFADRAALNAILAASAWIGGGASVGMAVALAPVSRETDDITSRLFVPTFHSELGKKLWDFFGKRHPSEMTSFPSQDAYFVGAHFEDPESSVRNSWALRASWDGAVAAAAVFNPAATTLLSGFDHVLLPGWSAILPLVQRLGGYGTVRLTFLTTVAHREHGDGTYDAHAPVPSEGTLYSRLAPKTYVRRAVPLEEPRPEDIGSIQREMQRAAGIDSFETDPGAM